MYVISPGEWAEFFGYVFIFLLLTVPFMGNWAFAILALVITIGIIRGHRQRP